jgi:hypothetical protein
VLLSKVQESSEAMPKATREQKERGRKKGDDANASRHGGAVKRSKSKVEGWQKRKGRKKGLTRSQEKKRREKGGELSRTGSLALYGRFGVFEHL